MMFYRRFLFVPLLLLGVFACRPDPPVSFNADVRPILNQRCIGCHGGVRQAGGFGLVYRENALGPTHSGKPAIVPGDAAASELIRRARHVHPDVRMPLDAPPLSEVEIRTLERWIDQGAKWEEHWAYLPIAPPTPPPPGEHADWVTHDLDRYVAADLTTAGLRPNAPAGDTTLLRRVSLDLTGLPAAPALQTAFLTGALPYAALVDSLLASPAYGEHWAGKWLDLARYADTRGLEKDRGRDIWNYRDWVIRAYDADLPYDRFVTEQLAGDLLPDPTRDQLIATAFHRNTMSNDEGGTDNEEWRVVSVIDRVNTTWEVFQGTTMACVQCHGHPYDPIRHAEYYRSFALWNQTVDRDHAEEFPYLRTFYPAEETKYRALEDWIDEHAADAAERRRREWFSMLQLREPHYRPDQFTNVRGGTFAGRAEAEDLLLDAGGSFTLPARDLTGVRGLPLLVRFPGARGRLVVRLGAAAGAVVGVLEAGGEHPEWHQHRRISLKPQRGKHVLHFTAEGTGERVVGITSVGVEPPLPGADATDVARIEAFITDLTESWQASRTPVMQRVEPEARRPNFVFERGNWQVRGPDVTPGVPALLATPGADSITDRLAFARWLTGPDQPLTARVAVNRVWASLFGRGIVPSLEDLGSQGAPNHHPALLDHLADYYRTDLAWSQKALLRYLVTSSTYRQDSRAHPELLRQDPDNDLLARGPRRRLTAEEVHDQILAVAGLLSDKRYGPGVMPPQPEGLWDNIPYSNDKWVTSVGEDRYRRAVYTYLRRSVAHPMLTTFDGPNREMCVSRRVNTNTPLQALMTLNDPLYLEAAAALAERARTTEIVAEQIGELSHLILGRPVTARELTVLTQLYDEAYAGLQVSASRRAHESLVVVANALLNLDEFLTLS